MSSRHSAAALDAVVDKLLGDAAARVVAMSETGLVVPMPGSVPLREQALVTGVPTLLELVDPDDIVKVIDMWAEARERGAASVQVRSLREAGQPITVHAVDATHRYGVYLGFLVGYREASDAEAARGQDALRPRVCVVRKNELAHLTHVDETATRLLGWTQEETVGQRSLELTHPDDQQRAIANWMDLLSSPGSARRTRLRQRHADGTWMWFEVTNRNLLNHPDYRCVLTEMVDIAEEMAVTEALRASEQLLRRLTEALPVGILQLDIVGTTVYRNERLTTVVGRELASVFDLYELMVDPEPLRERLRAVRDQRADADVETEISGPEGFRRRISISVRGLHSEDGECTGAILTVSDVTDEARLREQLAHKATHDGLTQCLLRGAVIDRLDTMLADLPTAAEANPARTVSVLFIDLDGFKDVNDRYGHAAGDAMLREVGRRLLADAGTAVVGRFGGDEFVVLRDDLPDGEAARAAANVVSEKLATPFEHAGTTLVPHASVGAAWAAVREAADPLVARADADMYRAKRARPDRRARRESQPVRGR